MTPALKNITALFIICLMQVQVVAGRRYHLYRTFLGSERKAHMHLQLSRFMNPENPGWPCATKPKRLKGS